jgi:hypothetical protein
MAFRFHGQEALTAILGAGAVTGAKMAPPLALSAAFVGHNGAGACTLTGATVGQRVAFLYGAPTAGGALVEASASFESTISVAGQIQQSSASNLSTDTYIVGLLPVAA